MPVASTTPISVATHSPRKSSGIAIIGSSVLPNGVATDDDDDDDDEDEDEDDDDDNDDDDGDDDDDDDDANGTAAADVSERREVGPAAAAPSARPCCMVQKIAHLQLSPHVPPPDRIFFAVSSQQQCNIASSETATLWYHTVVHIQVLNGTVKIHHVTRTKCAACTVLRAY